MPRLVVLRHAKAVTGFGMADIERPLAGRGHRDAAVAGERLRAEDLLPDLVLCSPATRTRETLEDLEFGEVAVRYEPSIYDNDVDGLFDLVRQTPDEVGTLLLIGHNPSFHQLAHDLTGDGPETFPTCALAAVQLPGPWPETWPGAGTLTYLWTPKGP